MPTLIRTLKTLQIAVAIATTLALGAGLLWPGVMGLFLVPFALIFVIWAIRAARNHRLSVWLSFTTTLMIALVLGAFALDNASRAFDDDSAVPVVPPVLMDPLGNVIEAPPETLAAFTQAQARIERRDRIHAGLLLLIASGAWLVVVLYAIAWRWALGAGKIARVPR